MIFIVGSSRSGTTMVGRIMGKNPEVHTFGELHFFENLIESEDVRTRPALPDREARALVARLLTSSRKDLFAPTESAAYRADIDAILATTEPHDAVSLYLAVLAHETKTAGARVACEQTPRYLFSLKEVFAAVPHARVIVIIRDPRAVLVSQANKWRRRFLGATNIPRREALRSWANYHPLMIAKLWASCSQASRRYARDERVMEVRFEELLADPATVVREMADHAGVVFDEAMLDVPQVGSSHGKDSPDKLGVNPAMISSWKNGDLGRIGTALCEWVAGDEMRARGYKLEGDGRFPVGAVPSMAMLAAKMSVALPLNLSRTKNLAETVRRRFGKVQA